MKFRTLIKDKDGRVRLVWLWLLGFAICIAWVWGTDALFEAIFGRLSGLTHEGALQTPLWELFSERGWAALASVTESVGLILIFSVICRGLRIQAEPEKFNHRICTFWVCVGALAALAGIGLCLLTDSLRPVHPYRQPNFTLMTLVAMPQIFLATRAGEVFMMDFLYDSARSRLPRPIALALVVVVEFLTDAAWQLSWLGMINVVLQVVLVSELHERHGLAAAAGLWFGWDYVLSVLFPIDSPGVWQLYRVSDPWLTGGHHGLFEGAWMTFVLLVIMLCLFISKRAKGRRDGEMTDAAQLN